MALKALPGDVRALLSASAQINNYKIAVAELVYNSLDAESTSIAIRIHIQDHKIQVIDNGCGVTKNDFHALGQRHMTSKLTDLATLKSMPQCYGYRGEFLANIIEISRSVKIISRHKDGEETCAKTFCEGKKKQFAKMTTRPSKGTTVEVEGFLYNLNIQKRGIDPVNDLQHIKSFLEQLSLAHNDVSLSLRDDSKNEIIFKIHKKRDVYQTLSTLFNIEKNNVQELQVEKSEYRVKAFIGKIDTDASKHWIYLNGRFIEGNSKLHKIINENMRKYSQIKYKNKSKFKNDHNEDDIFKNSLPFYFIFVTCPYIDYHVSSTLRQSIVEFKNWEQIKKILEKLVKFYAGDVTVKEPNKTETKIPLKRPKDNVNDDTEDKIKKIINKILGNNPKRLEISQLQNGVKGKLVNRKKKKIKQRKQNYKHGSVHNRNKCVKSANNFIQNSDAKIRKVTISEKGTSVPSDQEDIFAVAHNKNGQDCDTNRNHEITMKNTSTLNNNENNPILHKTNDTPEVEETNLEGLNSVITNKCLKSRQHGNKKHKKANDKPSVKLLYKPKPTKVHKRRIKPTGNDKTNAIQLVTDITTGATKDKKVAHRTKQFYRHVDSRHKVENNYTNKINTLTLFTRYQNPISKYNDNIIDYDIEKYFRHKMAMNSFKTTYDLVQTILESQQGRRLDQIDSRCDVHFKRYPMYNLTAQTITKNINVTPEKPRISKNITVSNNTNFYSREECDTKFNNRYRYETFSELTTSPQKQNIDGSHIVKNTNATKKMQQSLRCEDIFRENSDTICTQYKPSRYSPNIRPESRLTYESHEYNDNVLGYINNICSIKSMDKYVNKVHNIRFISKQSKDNFMSSDKYRNNFKHRNFKPPNKRFKHYNVNVQQPSEESYIIEFTKSNEINCSVRYSEILLPNQTDFPVYNINDKTQSIYTCYSPNYTPMGFGNTYIVPSYSISTDCNAYYPQNQAQCNNSDQLFISNCTYYLNAVNKNPLPNVAKEKSSQEEDKASIVFVSKSQGSNNEDIPEDEIQPMEICEAVLYTDEYLEDESHCRVNSNNRLDNNSLCNNINNNKSDVGIDIEKYKTQIIKCHNNNEDVSHHFTNTLSQRDLKLIDDIEAGLQHSEMEATIKENNNAEENKLHLQNSNAERDNNIKHTTFNNSNNNFNFKDRLRFLPKGMSQIFEKCGSKAFCDYNLDTDYYEDVIYNDFANDVQMQTEIYEPVIQNVGDLATKSIYKFENKIHKDNTSLVFDKKSLQEAKVLNQVDCKFIAAIIKEKHINSEKTSKYLVLFDQHAVHERIRLEQNLADYFIDNKWKSAPLDNIKLKITKDEVLYLHNYKEKFNQLGLQWTILNKEEVSLSCIPEAILGKNPREVDKVLKAVKSLIAEQVGMIRLQKGCISLYPKSIMDLVFSEACRYAIKFGDKLSKNDCISLLNDLSSCKTPFQCAHGRPVMAVLLDIKNEFHDYKVDTSKLNDFKLTKMATIT